MTIKIYLHEIGHIIYYFKNDFKNGNIDVNYNKYKFLMNQYYNFIDSLYELSKIFEEKLDDNNVIISFCDSFKCEEIVKLIRMVNRFTTKYKYKCFGYSVNTKIECSF